MTFTDFGASRFRSIVPLRSISITGSYVDRDLDKAALAHYRVLLEATFPGTQIIIRTQWKPEGYGHARTVNIEPLTPATNPEAKRRLGITRMDIGDAWRAIPGGRRS